MWRYGVGVSTGPALHVVPPPDDGGALPDYPEHGARAVIWQAWRRAGIWTHIPLPCDACGDLAAAQGGMWLSWGALQPLPGEQVPVTVRHASRRGTGRQWESEGVRPAWAYVALMAYRCPTCRHTWAYDMGPDGRGCAPIDLAQPRLF